MAAAIAGTPTVGRARESARIGARLEAVRAGRGGVVLVSGEPGIGKTRLALDSADRARRDGCRVAWGRCPEAGAAPAFWPWTQVVRERLAGDGAALLDRLGPAAGDVRALLEARDLLPGGGAPGAELVTSQRFRLFDGVVRLLGAGPEPTVVVLEDLHRADEQSVAMFRQVAAEAGRLPLLLLVTYRSADVPGEGPLPAALADVVPLPWCDDVPLEPLGADEATRLVADLPECELDAGQVAAVVARAGGNPLFLEQLARTPRPSGQVPRSVRQVIREQVGALPPGCRPLLEAFAVAGREADVARAVAAAGLDVETAAPLLAAAAARGLLALAPEERVARFPHVLMQETLYAGLDPQRRARLHERFAELLEEPARQDPSLRAALAHHALRAARGGRAVDCVAPLRAAARAAAGRLAFGEAARLLAEALPECADRPALRAAVLVELGESEVRTGAAGAARAHLEQAADLASELGDGGTLAAAALGIGSCVVTVGQVDWGLVARLGQALQVVEDPATRARLHARLGVELYWHGGGSESRRVSAEALVEAERVPGDARTLAEALWARLFTLRGPGRLDERLTLGRRLVELAAQHGWDDVEARGRVWWAPELLRGGELPAYRATVDRLDALARRTGQPLHHWYAELFAAQRSLLAGEVQDAADRSRTAAAVAERLGTEAGEIYRLAQQVVLCRDVGGLGALVDPLQAVADRYPALVTLQMLLTVVQAELGQADDAAAGLARLAADEFAAVPPDSLWTATLCYAVEMAALLGDGRTAALAGRLVEPYRGTCAVQGVPVAWGAVDRAVGLARLASGDRTGGLAALEAALDLHRRWGCTALAVRTRLDLAAARGMDAEGRRHAQLARADAERLGLTRLVERATGLLDAAPVRLSGPGGTLSARETEVLDLLARGVSNQGIAARLVLSVNTVERHVRNLYLKLGVANRAEAAALAARSAAPGPPADHGFR